MAKGRKTTSPVAKGRQIPASSMNFGGCTDSILLNLPNSVVMLAQIDPCRHVAPTKASQTRNLLISQVSLQLTAETNHCHGIGKPHDA
jgi:hypothetical protein